MCAGRPGRSQLFREVIQPRCPKLGPRGWTGKKVGTPNFFSQNRDLLRNTAQVT